MIKNFILVTFSLINNALACTSQGFQPRTGVAFNSDSEDYYPVDYFMDQDIPSEVKQCQQSQHFKITDRPDILSKINNVTLSAYSKKNMNPTRKQAYFLCKDFKKITDAELQNTGDVTCKTQFVNRRNGIRYRGTTVVGTGIRIRGKRSVHRGNFISMSSSNDDEPSEDSKPKTVVMNKRLNKLFSILKKSTIDGLTEYFEVDADVDANPVFPDLSERPTNAEHEFSVFFRTTLIKIQKQYSDSFLPILGDYKNGNSKCFVESKIWMLICGMLKSDFEQHGIFKHGLFNEDGRVSNEEFCMF